MAGRINGIEAAEYIQSHCNIPFILITGFCDEVILKSIKNLKSTILLYKPFGTIDIEAAVEEALNKK